MLVSVASVVIVLLLLKQAFVSCVKIFDMEQHPVIKCYFKLGKTATEVSQDLKNVYDDDDCLSHAQVFQWFTHFQEGRESEDDPHPDRPVSVRSNENVEKAHAIVMQDRPITTRLLAERLGVSKEAAARQILERDLQKRKICSRFVPHCEAVYCFEIDLCDPTSPLLARFGTGKFFSLPEHETGPKRRTFQQHPLRCDRATERGFIAGLPAHFRGPV
jgi:hypothetical protein